MLQPVWRLPGMPAVLILTAAGFAGFAVLLPVAPLWATQGGADEAGSGLVNGVLMLTTILTQGFVPRLAMFILLGVTLAGGALITFAPQMVSTPWRPLAGWHCSRPRLPSPGGASVDLLTDTAHDPSWAHSSS